MGEYDGKFNDIFHQLDRTNKALETGNIRMNKMAVLQARHSEILDAHHERSTKMETVVEDVTKENNETKLEIAKQYSDLRLELERSQSKCKVKMAEIETSTKIAIEKIHADMEPVKKQVKKMGWLATLSGATPMILKLTALVLTIISAGAGAYYTFVYLIR